MRTAPRKPAVRPLHRTVLAGALALAFGAFDAHALNQTVSSTSGITMPVAINAANADWTARVAIDSTATCGGEEIVVDGTGGFIVSESTPLPALNCPGITIRGTGDGTYGGRINGANSSAYGGCGLNALSPANISSMEIDGFSYGGTTVGLCGNYGTIANSQIHNNDTGLQGSVVSFTGNTVWNNVNIGVDILNGSVIGGASAAARNAIYGNGTGIAVESGGSADIGFNYIGTPDGVSASYGNSTGIALFGNASTIHDNLISGNSSEGIDVDDAGGSVISRNTLGLDASGTIAVGNGEGIYVGTTGATIDSNVISGNSYGIHMNAGASVTNNIIGLDPSGTNPIGLPLTGVYLNGGTATVNNNTIAGMQYPIEFDFSSGGSIQGNRVGVNKNGTPVSGAQTQYEGIMLRCSNSVSVGTNVIGGMTVSGVSLHQSTGNLLYQNAIGVGTDGTTVLGNSGTGVVIDNPPCAARLAIGKSATSRPVAASTLSTSGGNTIKSNDISFNAAGGIAILAGASSSGNLIEFNRITGNGSGSGVAILDSASTGNAIVGNEIYANSPKNIDLNSVSPGTPLLNDLGDGDTGANDGLNYPEIQSVTQNGSQTVVTYVLDTPATAANYVVEFFTNPGAGIPGGQTSVRRTLQSGVSGQQTFTETFAGTLDNFSLTSTLAVDATTWIETSEFSPMVATTQLPALTVTPSSVNFGNIESGATSASSTTVTLQSVGAAPYILHTFLTTGACGDISSVPLNCGGSGFICSTDCVYDTAMAPGTACTVTASFAPQTVGPSNLTIQLCPVTGPVQQIQLSGNGTLPPPVSVTPNGFNFGNVLLGTSSPAQSFTISNPAQMPVTLTAPVAAAPFAVTSTTCGATLAALSSCTANATFTPSAVGPAPGQLSLSFTSTATGTPVTAPAAAAIAGIGVAVIQVSLPPSVNVGTYVIGLAPATATATVTNTGRTAASLSAITASAPFTAANNCGTSLASNASCTITISLASTTVGPVTGNVTVTTPAGPQLIALTGVVAPAAIKFVPAQADFGQVLVNKSATRDIVATNTSGLAVAIGTPAVSAPFTIASSTCGAILAANELCTVTVAFAPQHGGPASGVLTLNFGVNASMAAAAAPAKRGTKVATSAATAIATLTASAIDAAALDMPSLIEFGTYIVGSAPIVRTATITSSGDGVVTFQDISASGPFGLTSDCPLNLAPGDSCTLTITYSSSTLGPAAGLVTIRSNAIGGLRTISLGALTQLKPVPIVDVKPSTISFGDRLIGTQSPAVAVTVSNSGGADAILGPLTVSSDYVLVSTTCAGTLAMQSTCIANVAMRPIGLGSRPGSLSFTSNADGSPHIVSLGGNGCLPPSEEANRGASGGSCGP